MPSLRITKSFPRGTLSDPEDLEVRPKYPSLFYADTCGKRFPLETSNSRSHATCRQQESVSIPDAREPRCKRLRKTAQIKLKQRQLQWKVLLVATFLMTLITQTSAGKIYEIQPGFPCAGVKFTILSTKQNSSKEITSMTISMKEQTVGDICYDEAKIVWNKEQLSKLKNGVRPVDLNQGERSQNTGRHTVKSSEGEVQRDARFLGMRLTADNLKKLEDDLGFRERRTLGRNASAQHNVISGRSSRDRSSSGTGRSVNSAPRKKVWVWKVYYKQGGWMRVLPKTEKVLRETFPYGNEKKSWSAIAEYNVGVSWKNYKAVQGYPHCLRFNDPNIACESGVTEKFKEGKFYQVKTTVKSKGWKEVEYHYFYRPMKCERGYE